MDKSYTDLICRYCDGMLSEDEEKELLLWIRESYDNKLQFRAVEKEWRKSHTASLAARIAVAKARNKAHRTRMRTVFTVSAASIAALALVAVFIFKGQSGPSKPHTIFNVAQDVCICVPMASTTEVTLPDGTKVCLNAGSQLNYNKHFNKKNRDIFLRGEAYFDVTHNESLPFVVHTADCKMTVLGTRFDVYAYEGEGVTYAALLEGSLRFDAGTSTVLISPDELATFDGLSIIKSIAETDQYISWINGEIKYDEISLSEFLNRLSRLYDVPITYSSSSLDSRKFRAAFTKKETIDNILKAVCDLLPIKAEKQNEGYSVNEL